MELALNLIWFAVAATAFLLVPKSDRRVWVALACAAAVLFPIISMSDDMSVDRTLVDVAAALLATILAIALIAVARINGLERSHYALALSIPSDPRSPPAR